MEKTEFAGLTQLDPSDSLSEDGFSFQSVNPKIIDFLLRVGAQTHRHDAHDALAIPTDDPVLAVLDTGGTIPADTSITVGYTLIDADGGETTLNTDPQIITTQAGLATPTDAPTLVADNDAGTLLAGSYSYAVTIVDDGGGETALGPSATVVLPAGPASNEVEVSGLDALVTASGGTGWRLWRSVNGADWALINDGVTASILDDGTLCADRGVEPPTSTTGTTNATNVLRVTVPSPQPDAVQFRIYASLDGTFASPALLGTYDVSELDVVQEFTELSPLEGSPPAKSLAIAGASRIQASDIDGLTALINAGVAAGIAALSWKAPVADAAALAAVTGENEGDIRLKLDDMTLWGYNGATWQEVPAAFADADSIGDWTETLVVDETFDGTSLSRYYTGLGPSVVEGSGVATLLSGTGGSQEYIYHTLTEYADHEQIVQFIPAGGFSFNGIVLKKLDPIGFTIRLCVVVADNSFRVMKISDPGTVLSTIDSVVVTPSLGLGDEVWIRAAIEGDDVIAELWSSDPDLGGAPDYSLTPTLSGGDETTYGTGVIGEQGLRFVGDDHAMDNHRIRQWPPYSWEPAGSPYADPRARLETLGGKQRVYLGGAITGGIVGAAWKIPELGGVDPFPAERQFFTYGTAKLSVHEDGVLYVDDIGTETDIPLDGISFWLD